MCVCVCSNLLSSPSRFGRSSKHRDKHRGNHLRDLSPAQSLPEESLGRFRRRSGSFESPESPQSDIVGDHQHPRDHPLKRSATSEYNLKSRAFDSDEEIEDTTEKTERKSATLPSGQRPPYRHSFAVLRDIDDPDVTESETVQV